MKAARLAVAGFLVAGAVAVVALYPGVERGGGHGRFGAALAASPDEALPIDVGGPFALVDHTGRPRTHADFRGEYLIVYFGYTECPNTCSTALMTIAAALDELAAGGDMVGALFITVDPSHDTPARLADFVARVHPRLVGLTGATDEIERVQRAYLIGARQRAGADDEPRLFEHSRIAYLMGPDGDILTLFPPILAPQRLAAIVRGYMQ